MTLITEEPTMQLHLQPTSPAQAHLLHAHNIWLAHGQESTALGHITAGLLALAKQVDRIEEALVERAGA